MWLPVLRSCSADPSPVRVFGVVLLVASDEMFHLATFVVTRTFDSAIVVEQPSSESMSPVVAPV